MCDYWQCKYKEQCKLRHSDRKYTPCASCTGFDKCSHCANYISCCDLVVRYLPDMFRRLVKEIRTGEDTVKAQQSILRATDRRKGKR